MKLPTQSLASLNKQLIQDLLSRKDITLVAVTKTADASLIKELLLEGVKNIGENKVQDFEMKLASPNTGLGEALLKNMCKTHFIGHLQSNKAKQAVELFGVIQSVDSEKIAKKINDVAKELNKKMEVMIQVNIGKEAQKHGVMPEDVTGFFEKINSLSNLNIIGLMCIAHEFHESESEETRSYFRKMRELFDEINANLPNENLYDGPKKLTYLSMGMTNDYLIALQEGANMIRLGRILYRGKCGGY